MAKRFDICIPRAKKDGGTYWHRIGTAFEGEKGIGLLFDSLPLPDKEGRTSAQLFEPREKVPKADSDTDRVPGAAVMPKRADMDDEIPF